MVLPETICEIPSRIKVEKGKNSGTCYVKVNMEKLASMPLYKDGRYKLLVLGLEIREPSEYELAEDNTSVVIVLDLNSSYWDNIAENLPESQIRDLFPIY